MWALGHAATIGACSPTRDCNAPSPYSSLTLEESNTLTYVASDNFVASSRTAIEQGMALATNFLGISSNTRIYMYEPNGLDSAYATVTANMCEFWSRIDSGCGDSEKTSAQGGGGQYYLSGVTGCMNNGLTYTGAPVFMMPSVTDDDSNLKMRAVHEFTHVYQKAAAGGALPAWLMEGGAVYMECVLAQRAGTRSSFSECFKYGGGGGGILRNARGLYLSSPSTPWLTMYGGDRCCGSACGTAGNVCAVGGDESACTFDNGGSNTQYERAVFYDLGALAIAFAVQRANDTHTETGGRTTKDFFQSRSKGFWLAVEPVEIDLVDGWPSDVPEGSGWKGALAAFTGDATVADFYAAFEDAMVAGTVATEPELLARLEDDDAVHSASGEAVAYDGGDYFVGAKTKNSTMSAQPSLYPPPSSPPEGLAESPPAAAASPPAAPSPAIPLPPSDRSEDSAAASLGSGALGTPLLVAATGVLLRRR